jgi:hypothetical protein
MSSIPGLPKLTNPAPPEEEEEEPWPQPPVIMNLSELPLEVRIGLMTGRMFDAMATVDDGVNKLTLRKKASKATREELGDVKWWLGMVWMELRELQRQVEGLRREMTK